MRKSVQEPKRTEIPQDGKLGLPLYSCGTMLIESLARSYKPTTSRERGWDLLHRQSRNVGPLPRHSGHGEGEALPLRGVRETVQEPERAQISQVPLTALQPRAQTGRRHERSHQHAGIERQYRRSRPHRFGGRDGPITAIPTDHASVAPRFPFSVQNTRLLDHFTVKSSLLVLPNIKL